MPQHKDMVSCTSTKIGIHDQIWHGVLLCVTSILKPAWQRAADEQSTCTISQSATLQKTRLYCCTSPGYHLPSCDASDVNHHRIPCFRYRETRLPRQVQLTQEQAGSQIYHLLVSQGDVQHQQEESVPSPLSNSPETAQLRRAITYEKTTEKDNSLYCAAFRRALQHFYHCSHMASAQQTPML